MKRSKEVFPAYAGVFPVADFNLPSVVRLPRIRGVFPT